MNGLGVPAPVVTTRTSSSIMTSTSSGQFGIISIIFTAKGFVVFSLQRRICSRNASADNPPDAIIPRPPAFDTAEANSYVAICAIAPCKIGYLICSISVKLIFFSPLYFYANSLVGCFFSRNL